ncbi:hypothetical protein [Nonomuraea salmonea]|uniref:hypothetical protein n=1 Tax=Nonomuraea salmonea TaxID=46181 RepID=UPI0031EE5A90
MAATPQQEEDLRGAGEHGGGRRPRPGGVIERQGGAGGHRQTGHHEQRDCGEPGGQE